MLENPFIWQFIFALKPKEAFCGKKAQFIRIGATYAKEVLSTSAAQWDQFAFHSKLFSWPRFQGCLAVGLKIARQAGWLFKNICRQCDCCLWANISFLWWWSFLWDAKCAHPLYIPMFNHIDDLKIPPNFSCSEELQDVDHPSLPPKWENPPSSISSAAGDNQSAYQSTCRPVGLNFATTWSFSTQSCNCICPLSL